MNIQSTTSGWLFGLGAFMWWGVAPIYFKFITHVGAIEILAHRVFWCIPVTIILMALIKKKIAILSIIKNPRLIIGLTISTALISVNWLIFTWAVTNEQILATSLGYFINPVMTIVMGVILLGERLDKIQWLAVVFVIFGVANQVFNFGEFPWIALSLAISFAIYGFIKKQLKVDPLNGFLVETLIALPFALGYIIWSLPQPDTQFINAGIESDLWLIAGGIVTAVPLILFTTAAQRIPLSGLGFLQFLAPSISFVIATQLYNEPLSDAQFLSFILIWLGLALYLIKPIKSFVKN